MTPVTPHRRGRERGVPEPVDQLGPVQHERQGDAEDAAPTGRGGAPVSQSANAYWMSASEAPAVTRARRRPSAPAAQSRPASAAATAIPGVGSASTGSPARTTIGASANAGVIRRRARRLNGPRRQGRPRQPRRAAGGGPPRGTAPARSARRPPVDDAKAQRGELGQPELDARASRAGRPSRAAASTEPPARGPDRVHASTIEVEAATGEIAERVGNRASSRGAQRDHERLRAAGRGAAPARGPWPRR